MQNIVDQTIVKSDILKQKLYESDEKLNGTPDQTKSQLYSQTCGHSYPAVKRALDAAIALLNLVLLGPLFLILSLLVYLSDGGSPFFSQLRVGRNGKNFNLLKFRSMIVGADKKGPHFTAQGDERVTKIGAFLRKTSLDELPQLINVLKGDMSIIGPRPDVPVQRELYSENEFKLRHSVRPGITGLAQVMGRHTVTVKQRKRWDLYYARRLNLMLDIRILWLTVKTVFRGSF